MNFLEFHELKSKPKAPWRKYYREVEMEFNIEEKTLYEYVETKVQKFSELYCFDYYGNKFRYKEFFCMIDICAKGFYNSGIRSGDVITVCVPNTIEGIVSLLAANKIGAIVNFIHPLSSENEIKDSLNETNSKIIVLIDLNFIKVRNIINETNIEKVVMVNLCGYMPFFTKLRYSLKDKMKIKFAREDSKYIWWDEFLLLSEKISVDNYIHNGLKNDPVMILHSGGTTGSPKGVVLSNNNLMSFIESAMVTHDYLSKGDVVLALMPIFHGFGIVHSVLFPLCIGMHIVLRPKFEVKEYCKMIENHKPQLLMGVPTLFESLLNEWNNTKFKLDFLKYALVGGDSLKPQLRARINDFFTAHSSDIKICEGYGLTEAVCGVALGNQKFDKPEHVGVPMPGVYVGIFSSEDEEVPYGEEGEICVCGPTVMLGYYNNVEETKIALHTHKDGNVWLHTGDIGTMDEDGFITYASRLKRMIISSGYNVYPSHIERLLESHPAVKACAVVGIPHKYKIEVPKAFIVLKEGHYRNELLILELRAICMKNLPKYSWPYGYEFIEKLPTTRVGKINFRELQNSCNKE